MKIFVHRRKHERREQNRGMHRCTRTHFICKILIKTNVNSKVLEMHHKIPKSKCDVHLCAHPHEKERGT